MNKAKEFCRRVGYPCLIRPSYVLSGAAMKVCFNDGDLTKFLQLACTVSGDNPVVISKFIEGAKEIEVDAVAHNGKVLNYAIGEHVENAGVHSGDATLILPAQKLGVETASTGEVATFGEDKYDAILTSMMASGFKQPKSTVFVCIGPLHCKLEFLQSARELLDLGLTLYCSQGTYDFYKGHGLAVKLLHKPSAQKEPNVASYLA